MKRLLGCSLLVAACTNTPPPLPGQSLGSFLFTGELVLTAGNTSATSCLVDGPVDAGSLAVPTTIQFYAQMALLDAGEIIWLRQNSGPVLGSMDGGFVGIEDGGWMEVAIPIDGGIVSECGECTTSIVETITLYSSVGFVPGLTSLVGLLDDSYQGAGTGVTCSVSDGGQCLFACDVVYAISGVPGAQ